MKMRIRQIKPEFWSDAALQTATTPEEQLFYIGTWNLADDAGWLRWEPVEIAADLYRYQPSAKRLKAVERCAAKLSALGRIVIYECGHAFIPTLTKHQHLSAETKRVYTIVREHEERCGLRELPADSRGDPRSAGRDGFGQVRKGEVRASDSNGDDLEAVCDLILRKWGWPRVTPDQRRLVEELADHQAEGARGYGRLLAILTVTSTKEDPLEALKAEDASNRRAGTLRAEAQEAESAKRHQSARGGDGHMASLGEATDSAMGTSR